MNTIEDLPNAEQEWLVLVLRFLNENSGSLLCPHCGSDQILVEFYENGFTLMCNLCHQFHHLRGLPEWFQPNYHPLKRMLKLVDL